MPVRTACPAFALVVALAMAASPSFAVTLIHNAHIHTVNKKQPQASAMAFDADGKILAVGDESLIKRFPDAERIDFAGKTIVPGLIDAHVHLMGLGIARARVDLVGSESKEEILRRLQSFESTLEEDEWLTGRGWDQNDWVVREFPNAADLDDLFPNRPVWLDRIDGHAAWANTAAMKKSTVDVTIAVDPQGGRIMRDEQGRPTGIFLDAAKVFIDKGVPALSEETLDRALHVAVREANSAGLTGVHEAGTSLYAVHRYRRAIDAGELSLRIYAMADGMQDTFAALCRDGPFEYKNRLSMRSVKLYMDGALGSRGAALLADYSDDPGNRGLLFTQPDVFAEYVADVMRCGLQVNTHAIGDNGIRVVLDAYEKGIAATGGGPGRHRIEHAQIIALEDIPRFGELNVIASMQPTHATSDMYWAEDRLGPERIQGAYAWRKLLDTGARLAFGSDFPVEGVAPLLGFHASVARQDLKNWPEGGWYPGERLTREEALKAFTLDAAYAAFQERQIGSLEVGKRADFVVLSADIMSIPAEEIPATRVLSTWLDGKRVYAAD